MKLLVCVKPRCPVILSKAGGGGVGVQLGNSSGLNDREVWHGYCDAIMTKAEQEGGIDQLEYTGLTRKSQDHWEKREQSGGLRPCSAVLVGVSMFACLHVLKFCFLQRLPLDAGRVEQCEYFHEVFLLIKLSNERQLISCTKDTIVCSTCLPVALSGRQEKTVFFLLTAHEVRSSQRAFLCVTAFRIVMISLRFLSDWFLSDRQI